MDAASMFRLLLMRIIFLQEKTELFWGTYDLRQAEIIQNTLLAQHINCELKKIALQDLDMFLISITNEREIEVAIEFIWKSNSGLRLKPDWSYHEDEPNKSFELWLSGH